ARDRERARRRRPRAPHGGPRRPGPPARPSLDLSPRPSPAMNFDLSESQRQIRDLCREFAEREIRPRAAEIDRMDEFPQDRYKRMAELDILGMSVPPESGGSGADTLSWCVAQEELARGSAVVSDAQLLSKLTCDMLLQNGSEAQRRRYLPAMVRGEKICCIAQT